MQGPGTPQRPGPESDPYEAESRSRGSAHGEGDGSGGSRATGPGAIRSDEVAGRADVPQAEDDAGPHRRLEIAEVSERGEQDASERDLLQERRSHGNAHHDLVGGGRPPQVFQSAIGDPARRAPACERHEQRRGDEGTEPEPGRDSGRGGTGADEVGDAQPESSDPDRDDQGGQQNVGGNEEAVVEGRPEVEQIVVREEYEYESEQAHRRAEEYPLELDRGRYLSRMRLEDLAARTPSERDRYVDLLRAFSITVVVLGHWLIAVVQRGEDKITVSSAIGATRGLWLLTWLLQVMPIFFFVGGFSNLKTYEATLRRGGSYRDFMRIRTARLLKPVAVFLGVWLVAQVVLHALEVGEGLIRPSAVPFGPLWFLVVYLAVVALVPVTLHLHRRYGFGPFVGILIAIALLDGIRFQPWERPIDLQRAPGELPFVVWLNVLFVWVFVHQLGYLYADGTLVQRGRTFFLRMAGVGLVGLIFLTNIDVYPRSMVGTDIERVSNMNPPTLAIVSLSLWLIGAVMLLRDRANRWLQRRRPWMAVIAANSVIMTAFLWHLTAYLIAIIVLFRLGLAQPGETNLSWWLQRPIWVIVPGIILAGFVVLFGHFERPARSRPGISAT